MQFVEGLFLIIFSPLRDEQKSNHNEQIPRGKLCLIIRT
ncbi:hypothetical protein JCM19233_949 [Vibrio astriarenae]|nr:hypothetical protein JCM19233_949 [Vibrio sp. C7]